MWDGMFVNNCVPSSTDLLRCGTSPRSIPFVRLVANLWWCLLGTDQSDVLCRPFSVSCYSSDLDKCRCERFVRISGNNTSADFAIPVMRFIGEKGKFDHTKKINLTPINIRNVTDFLIWQIWFLGQFSIHKQFSTWTCGVASLIPITAMKREPKLQEKILCIVIWVTIFFVPASKMGFCHEPF
jgi:hypothetical protein